MIRKKAIAWLLIVAMALGIGMPVSAMENDAEIGYEEEIPLEEAENENLNDENQKVVEDNSVQDYGQNSISDVPQTESPATLDNNEIENQEAGEEYNSENEEEELAYVYIDEQVIKAPGTQYVVISFLNKDIDIREAELNYLLYGNSEGYVVNSQKIEQNKILFAIEYPSGSTEGEYQLGCVSYETADGVDHVIDIEDENCSYMVKSADDVEKEETAEISTYSIGQDGVLIQEEGNDPERVIEETLDQNNNGDVENRSAKTTDGRLVVAICAGHDSNHTGASANGLREEELTLKVARYCAQELEQYNDVSVVMIRDTENCKYSNVDTSTCLQRRVYDAYNAGADLFVDIHFNAASEGAYGAEVWYPNNSFSESISQTGKDVATAILEELESLGLHNRGAKIKDLASREPDANGNPADYYYTNYACKQLGFTGIIVEHAFITNPSDALKLKDENFLRSLGIADATGIAKKYGLSKGAVKVSPSSRVVIGNEVTISLNLNQIENGYNEFQFLYYDGNQWNILQDYSAKTEAVWKPKKLGTNFMFAVYARNSDNDVKKYDAPGFYSVIDPTVVIHGINVERQGAGFLVSSSLSADTSALEYQYQVYDYSTQKWQVLNETEAGDAEWFPEKSGDYGLYVKVSAISGSYWELMQVYTVEDIYISDIVLGNLKNNGTIKLNIDMLSFTSDLKYTYLVYDMSAWKAIKYNSESAEVEWSPEKEGQHLLHVEVTGDSGKTYTYEKMVTVTDESAEITEFTVDKESPQKVGTSIRLSGKAEASLKGTKYRYIVYDGQSWSDIRTSDKLEEAEWSPEREGEYLLCFQLELGGGRTVNEFKNYSIKGLYTEVTDINVGGLSEEGDITLEAEVISTDTNLKYTYLVYDMSAWKAIKYNSESAEVKWSPEKEGQHLLHVEVTGDSGKTYTYEKMVNVTDESAEITEFTVDKESPQKVGTSIRLSGKAEASLKGTKYRYIVYDGQSWSDIRTSDKLEEAEWSPEREGEYLLCFQLELGGGRTVNEFKNYSIKGLYTEVTDIKVGGLSEEGDITLEAEVISTDTNLKYTYLVYDMSAWKAIKYNSESAEVKWSPEKEGQHLLHVEVTGDSGKTYTYEKMVTVTDENAEITEFTVDKESPQKVGTSIRLSGKAEASLKGTKYRYIVYDGQSWSDIKTSDKPEEAEWSPEREGEYLLCFQLELGGGRTVNEFKNYSIKGLYTEVTDIKVGGLSEEGDITLEAEVISTDTNLKYTYLVYDMSAWKAIKYNSESAEVKWSPEKEGQHLLHVEVTGDSGKTYTYEKMVNVTDENAEITEFTVDKESPQKVGTSIRLSGKAEASLKGTKYRYIVYDGQSWSDIKTSDKLEEAEWSPEREGEYLLCFQLELGGGRTVNEFKNYSIKGLYTEVTDIKVGGLSEEGDITLETEVISTDTNLKYTYLVYDMSAWKTIKYNSESAEVKWSPEKEGQHLLHVEVTGDSGKTYTYEKMVTVTDDLEIVSFSTDKVPPQKVGTTVKLLGEVTPSKLGGEVYRYIVFDGYEWKDIKTSSILEEAEWTPSKNGNYILCLQVIVKGGRQINQFVNFTISDLHEIMGDSYTSVNQMVAYFESSGKTYPAEVMKKGGAGTIEEFCKIYIEEAEAERVKPEVAFCQAMLETGFLQYGGDVKAEQYNFAGLGATGNGVAGNSFPTVRIGVRAQIQHLKCYASTEKLNNSLEDPRWNEYLRGKAPYVEWLSIKTNPYGTGWASDPNYGINIIRGIDQLYGFSL